MRNIGFLGWNSYQKIKIWIHGIQPVSCQLCTLHLLQQLPVLLPAGDRVQGGHQVAQGAVWQGQGYRQYQQHCGCLCRNQKWFHFFKTVIWTERWSLQQINISSLCSFNFFLTNLSSQTPFKQVFSSQLSLHFNLTYHHQALLNNCLFHN